MGQRINLSGKRFGRLVAIKDIGTKNKRRLWLCRCNCGKMTKVITGVLRIGKTKSCGCLNREPTKQLPLGIASFNELFASYKFNAKNNNRIFNLTKDDFRKLTSSLCYYCGEPPTQILKRSKANGDYIYNGIDRVNSEEGYTIENCVPCCKRCNIAKHNFSKEDFYIWIKQVYNNLFRKES